MTTTSLYDQLAGTHGSVAIHAGRLPDLLATDAHHPENILSIRVSGRGSVFSVWLSGTFEEIDDWLAAIAGKVAELRTVPDTPPCVPDDGAVLSAAPSSSTRINLVEAPL